MTGRFSQYLAQSERQTILATLAQLPADARAVVERKAEEIRLQRIAEKLVASDFPRI